MPLRGTVYLRQNIAALIVSRRSNQTAVAFAAGMKDGTSLNKFLKDQPGRELQLHQIEKIADFFGVEVYQLFSPSITPELDRRSGKERRRGKDRRQKRVSDKA